MSSKEKKEKKKEKKEKKEKVKPVEDDSDTEIDEGEKLYEGMATKTYRWTIPDFPSMYKGEEEKERSPVFEIGNCQWDMLLFPKGNQKAKGSDLSLYLEVADKDELPTGWRRDARMWLHVVNQKDEKKSVRQETAKVFSSDCVDWGFPQLIPFKKLFKDEGFLVDGTLILEVEILVFRAWIDYGALRNFRLKTREQTGYVGLYNQGATCYLNAWIQALFHVGAFRRAVYQIGTSEEDLKKSIPLALQRLFYRLQFNEDSTETVELTTAFGWGKEEVRTQHDVHELNCLLLDNLERKMKKSPAEGAVERLFRGEVVNYIECVNVDYRVERPEHMYGFGLQVQGNKNIYESFKMYMEAELLTEPNQYRTDDYGLQDANKGVFIKRLPPVLLVQLKRWVFDLHRLANIKVNDKYAFHPVLDLSAFLPADNNDSGVYHLHAILVHSGSSFGGHYYAYCRPTSGPDWFLFDDSRVAKATEKEALEDNWGGSEKHTYKRFGRVFEWTRELSSNAYMLVYVRETEVHSIMNDDADDAIPKHVHEVGEEHLYTEMKIATSANFAKHNMERFDLISSREIEPMRVKRSATLAQMQHSVGAKLGIPAERQRIWVFMLRDNHTVRPERCLTPQELEKTSVETFLKSDVFADSQEMVWIEDIGEKSPPPPLIDNFDDCSSVVIFFKLFDPVEQRITFLGHEQFDGRDTTKCDAFVPVVRRLAGFSDDEEIVFFEEITKRRIDPLPLGKTLAESELFPGDIIVVMKALPEEELAKCRTSNPRSYSQDIRHRVKVRFRPLATPHDEQAEVTLVLNKTMKYPVVAAELAKALDADPDKIRFTGYNPTSDGPRRDPCMPSHPLREMLSTFYGPPSDLLFFEVLMVARDKLGDMCELKLCFQSADGLSSRNLQIHVERDTTIEQALAVFEKQLGPDELTFNTGRFHLMEVYSHKIFKVHRPDASVEKLSQYSTYFVQECAPEELDMGAGDRLSNVTHFEVSHLNNPFPWGVPFQMVIRPDETAAALKQRIKDRLKPDEKDFEKWKIAIVAYHRVSYLDDEDIVADQKFDEYTYIGIEHPDNTPTPTYQRWNKPQAHVPLTLAQSGEISK